MKKQNQIDVLQLLEQFQKTILQNKPSVGEMITEIHMMKFKVKPMQGDFSQVNFRNDRFIEALWSLGKLDEFFQIQYPHIKKEEKSTFFTYFDLLQKKLQEDLNHLNLRTTLDEGKQTILEMEIFKEHIKTKKPN